MASSPEVTPVAPAGESNSPKPVSTEGQTGTPPSATTAPAPAAAAPPATAEPDTAAVTGADGVNPLEFDGAVDSTHDLPTPETIRKIDNYVVLDRHGKSHTFRSLYTGRHAARRVLLIFVRHFFCGNCQDYLRTLSESITPPSLLALPLPTFIAVIGCGDPGLIQMYADATACPWPVYADPTRRLYDELGMVRTLALGERPAYARQHLLKSSLLSIGQGLRQIGAGLALKSGDQKQVGGEFLFEPVVRGGDVVVTSPVEERAAPLLEGGQQQQAGGGAGAEGGKQAERETSLDGQGEPGEGEDKVVTWCHRMRTTRDHAEIPELMEVLGLEGHGKPVEDPERWEKALKERKGKGTSLAAQMKKMEAAAGTA